MPIGRPREKIIPIRFTTEDWAKIKESSYKNFLDVSTWIRQVVLRELKTQEGKQ